jgi:hypothetical protein
MAGKSATPTNRRLDDMDIKLEDLHKEVINNKESVTDLSFKVAEIHNKLDDNILSINNKLDDFNAKLNENNNKFEELKSMLSNLTNKFLSSNIYQGEEKTLSQEFLSDLNAEDIINKTDNSYEDIKTSYNVNEDKDTDNVGKSMINRRSSGQFSAFFNQTPVNKSTEWKDNVKVMNESKGGVEKLKDIKDFKSAKEDAERINDTSKMQGMFPMIINMFNRNRNNAEAGDTKNYKLETCKEEYLMTNISENSFRNIVDWMYLIMRVKSDYPSHRIVLSKALDDASINAICSFFAAKCCVVAVTRVGKDKVCVYEPRKILNINAGTLRSLDLENILYIISQMILPLSHEEFKIVFKSFMEPFFPFKGNDLKMDLENQNEFKRRVNLFLNKLTELIHIAVNDWFNVDQLSLFDFHKERCDTMNHLILAPLLELGVIIQRKICNDMIKDIFVMNMEISSMNLLNFIGKIREIIENVGDKTIYNLHNAKAFNNQRANTALYFKNKSFNSNKSGSFQAKVPFGTSSFKDNNVRFISNHLIDKDVEDFLQYEKDVDDLMVNEINNNDTSNVNEDYIDQNQFSFVSHFHQAQDKNKFNYNSNGNKISNTSILTKPNFVKDEDAERINDTSRMQGMFPMIINMFNRNKNNAEASDTKNYKLEACEEQDNALYYYYIFEISILRLSFRHATLIARLYKDKNLLMNNQIINEIVHQYLCMVVRSFHEKYGYG